MDVEVISGFEEVRLIYLGVLQVLQPAVHCTTFPSVDGELTLTCSRAPSAQPLPQVSDNACRVRDIPCCCTCATPRLPSHRRCRSMTSCPSQWTLAAAAPRSCWVWTGRYTAKSNRAYTRNRIP